jgi:hypothetical protein
MSSHEEQEFPRVVGPLASETDASLNPDRNHAKTNGTSRHRIRRPALAWLALEGTELSILPQTGGLNRGKVAATKPGTGRALPPSGSKCQGHARSVMQLTNT